MKPESIDIPKDKLVKKILLKYKSEVFYKQELTEKIKEKFNVDIKPHTVRYHADKLVKQEEDIERYKLGQNEGVVWGYSDSIEKVKKRFEL